MEPDNEADLVRAVEHLCDDAALREELCRNGRAFVTTHYSRDALAERFLKIILATGRGGRPESVPSSA
jgi:glycosyltransferase involved in cell wall biosynthesis